MVPDCIKVNFPRRAHLSIALITLYIVPYSFFLVSLSVLRIIPHFAGIVISGHHYLVLLRSVRNIHDE
jgi:hypothetical protein